jgi:hypothetical protein
MLTDRLPQVLAKDSKVVHGNPVPVVLFTLLSIGTNNTLDARFDPIHSLKPFIDEVNLCLYCWEKELYTFYLPYVYHHHTFDMVKRPRGLESWALPRGVLNLVVLKTIENYRLRVSHPEGCGLVEL